MSYKYELKCETCGMVVGEISFDVEPAPHKLAVARSGYKCSECVEEEAQIA